MEIHEQLAARRFVLADEEGNPTAYITGAEVGFLGFHVEGPEKGKPVVSTGSKPKRACRSSRWTAQGAAS